MSAFGPRTSAWNATRQTCLATDVSVAKTHWSRLLGLIGKDASQFQTGRALWIIPCRGIHTLAMRFPIDAVYLNMEQEVVHIEQNLPPWRFAPVRMGAATVLELPANTVASTATVVGDRIAFRSEHGNGSG